MEREELKRIIDLTEGVERNINGWQNLKNRELAIIPTDSEYFKAFQEWKNQNESIYDGKIECQPSYIVGSKANEVLDLLIKNQEDFINKYKQKINKILTD